MISWLGKDRIEQILKILKFTYATSIRSCEDYRTCKVSISFGRVLCLLAVPFQVKASAASTMTTPFAESR